MLRATTIVRRAAVKDERVVDTVTLDHEGRHRRRIAMTGQGGLDFLLDLDRATVVDDGDGLKLDDGRLVRVRAAPERLIEIRTENPLRLMKVAWHLGNRHVATELAADAIYIAHDHVLLEMVRGLGAAAREVDRPFRPERGAYEGGHGHSHAHHHGHKHDHAHEHAHPHDHGHHGQSNDHDHGHGHPHDHAQAHGPDAACGCGHPHHHHGHNHGTDERGRGHG